MTNNAFFFQICQQLAESGIETNEAKSIAYLLFEHYTKLKRHEIHLNFDCPISERAETDIRLAVSSIATQKTPVQYVVGETEFYSLKFKVGAGVLIPRPETEELVDKIVQFGKQHKQKLHILDIGCGSGCIAVSLAAHLPHSKVIAVDVSPIALEYTRQNAAQNNADVQVEFADILQWQNYPIICAQHFDIIVSNPPYITENEKTNIDDNVLKHEPHLALFVTNHQPMQFYTPIATLAAQRLNKGGKLFLEINERFGNETVEVLKQCGLGNIELMKDMYGKHRMVEGERV